VSKGKILYTSDVLSFCIFDVLDEPESIQTRKSCLDCLSLYLAVYSKSNVNTGPSSSSRSHIIELTSSTLSSSSSSSTQCDLGTLVNVLLQLLSGQSRKITSQSSADWVTIILKAVSNYSQSMASSSAKSSSAAMAYSESLVDSVSTCMANVITITARKLHESSISSNSNPVHSAEADELRRALRTLAESTIPSLLFSVNNRLLMDKNIAMDSNKSFPPMGDSGSPTSVLSASLFAAAGLQALFQILFSLRDTAEPDSNSIGFGDSLHAVDCLDVAIRALTHNDGGVRCAGLKLIGACLALRSFREVAGPLKMMQVKRALEGVVNIEPVSRGSNSDGSSGDGRASSETAAENRSIAIRLLRCLAA
jgi:hypothetical protein